MITDFGSGVAVISARYLQIANSQECADKGSRDKFGMVARLIACQVAYGEIAVVQPTSTLR